MAEASEITRFSLYGEAPGGLAPEFVHLEPISARSSQYEWTIAPHAHPGIHQILLLMRGSALLARDDAQWRLSPVTLVTIPSGFVHAFRFEPEAEGWVLSLANDLLHDRRVAGLCDFGRPGSSGFGHVRLESASGEADRFGWLLADLARSLAPGVPRYLPNRIAAQLAFVLATAEDLLHADSAPELPAGRHEALATRFRDLVELHYRDNWSIDQYAASLGTTAPTLTRACRAILGRAPGEAVLDRVLLEAMRYLTYTAASIGQISDNLGFADPAYFARFFRKRTGRTASSFRRERSWLDSLARVSATAR